MWSHIICHRVDTKCGMFTSGLPAGEILTSGGHVVNGTKKSKNKKIKLFIETRQSKDIPSARQQIGWKYKTRLAWANYRLFLIRCCVHRLYFKQQYEYISLQFGMLSSHYPGPFAHTMQRHVSFTFFSSFFLAFSILRIKIIFARKTTQQTVS